MYIKYVCKNFTFAFQEKRFHNWLENARDWAVSRTRFWGTPLPIWRSTDGKEIVVVGSVKELEDLSGSKVCTSWFEGYPAHTMKRT